MIYLPFLKAIYSLNLTFEKCRLMGTNAAPRSFALPIYLLIASRGRKHYDAQVQRVRSGLYTLGEHMRDTNNGDKKSLAVFEKASRLEKLRQYLILDSGAETAYDDMTRLVCDQLKVPISLITFQDRHRHWYKSRVGMEASESARLGSFCEHGVTCGQGKVFVVEDALADPRFDTHPLVTSAPYIRFYAGAPIVSPDGDMFGMICAIDTVPRIIAAARLTMLSNIAADVMLLLEARLSSRQSADVSP